MLNNSSKNNNYNSAMVSIIELDREDGGRVEALGVELIDGAESLYDDIYGPRNWQPRCDINVLNEM